MANQFNLPKDKDLAKQYLEDQGKINKQNADQGLLGHVWGNASSIPNNIAALAIVLLSLTGIAYTLISLANPEKPSNLSVKDFWAIITPIITLTMGYLFGEKLHKKE